MSGSSASSRLKKLTRQPLNPERFRSILAEIESGDDRSVAIVWSAMVEDSLQAAIQRRMRPLSADEIDRLFDGQGPLSTFSAKIMVAYAVSAIGSEQKRALTNIKEIRNAFAHIPDSSFKTKEISDVCLQLGEYIKFAMPTHDNGLYLCEARYCYALTCVMLWTAQFDISGGIPIAGAMRR